LDNFHKVNKDDIDLSILYNLVKGNPIRKQVFQDITFYPKNQVIQHDFNFDGTLYRGLKFKSIKSVKILLQYIFNKSSSNEYYELVMLDLFEILTNHK